MVDMVDIIEKVILKALYMKQTQADFHAKLDWFVLLEFILMGFQMSVNTWNKVFGRRNELKKSMTKRKKIGIMSELERKKLSVILYINAQRH